MLDLQYCPSYGHDKINGEMKLRFQCDLSGPNYCLSKALLCEFESDKIISIALIRKPQGHKTNQFCLQNGNLRQQIIMIMMNTDIGLSLHAVCHVLQNQLA